MPKKKHKKSSAKLLDKEFDYDSILNAYNSFVKKGFHFDLKDNEFNIVGTKFIIDSKHLIDEIELFQKRLSSYSLMLLIFLWAQWIDNDRVLGEKYTSMMEQLLEKNLIIHINPKDNKLIKIGEFASLNPNTIIDNIRCYREWPIDKREDYAKFYMEFSIWLNKETFNFVPEAEDHDREITKQRKLQFDKYIEIIKRLDLRERILAKIFYLGGSVGLEEVLSLNINDINFKENKIKFSGGEIHFPRHVFEDIKDLLNKRKKGYVFVGKSNERINHTVPYRSLKAVVKKIGMPKTFTFKDFIKNK